MRIVAGRFKNRRLASPTWDGLRPTSDRLRETLFNVIASRVPGARVLDAFAGTGALGLEALSRGARDVVFVEQDRRAQALIAANLERCGVASGCAIIRAAVVPAVTALRAREGFVPFDLILLDPPYDTVAQERQAVSRPPRLGARASGDRGDACDFSTLLTVMGSCLAEAGLVVLEHARRRSTPDAAGPLVRVRELTAGDSALSFYTCQL